MAIASAATAADFVVSPKGSDTAPGTARAPFATIGRARLAVRALKAEQPGRATPIVVEIRGGTYYLPETLAFGAEDSGTAAAPVVYQAARGEEPVLSAGVPLTGWTAQRGGRMVAKLPEAWKFSQLYVNDQRRPRPMLPKQGYYYVEKSAPTEPNALPNAFIYGGDDIRADWKNLSEIEVCIFHSWNMSRIPIAAVDAQTRLVTLAGATWHASLNDITPKNWYRLENVAEALSMGEWYLDETAATVTYIPQRGERMSRLTVVAPRHAAAATFTHAQHITFRGLTLAHNNWNVPATGYSYAQAEAIIPGLIHATYSSHIRVEDCVIRNTGTYAAAFAHGCRDCAVTGCELFDLGAGGVSIGTEWKDDHHPETFAYTCTVENNLIAHGSRVHPAGMGVFIGHGATNRVTRNTIRDFYNSGVSVGWKWLPGPNPAHANEVSWNHIHTLGQGRTSDMGGIYTLGEQPGTVLCNNLIHDATRARYGAWGIYFDSASSHIRAESNIVLRCEDGSFMLSGIGQGNTVANNILALGQKNQLFLSGGGDDFRTSHIHRNIIYWHDGDPFLFGWPDPRIDLASNLYWRVNAPRDIDFGNSTPIGKWRERDTAAAVADPLFTNPAKDDFTLRPDTPAPALTGFRPFTLANAGCAITKPKTARLPAPPHTYAPAPAKKHITIRDGFEDTASGQGPQGWVVFANNRRDLVTVIDDPTAASGNRCLRVNDQIASYEPHFYIDVERRAGPVTFAFDLRLREGAQPSLEMRDTDPWYKAGPSASVSADRTLYAARGQPLLQLPLGEWVRIEIEADLSAPAADGYTIRVTHGGETRTFTGLYRNPAFKTLGWIGFNSNGPVGNTYDLDNLLLTP
ncbi:MAG: right-handed parallel beta-helix repeat-containing protein [Kiritimatiellaeota bacterium]|nr:right-handed parallel beta-helix repeat-containing protein [Kiritimatiellota bacterium]